MDVLEDVCIYILKSVHIHTKYEIVPNFILRKLDEKTLIKVDFRILFHL